LSLPFDAGGAAPSYRDFRSLVSILPQVNATFTSEGVIRDEPGAADANIAGSTGEGNFYFIDGNDVTSVQGAGARTSMSLPFDLIRAMDVKIGGYEAEYGRAMGGIVNVITPSGGNEPHGQAFAYFTNHSLFAESPNTQVGANDFATYDAGISLDGPIMRDRLWFFAAYNQVVDSRNQPITGLPDQDITSTVHRFAGKLTWQPTVRTRVATTFLGDPGDSRSSGAPIGFTVLNPEAVTADTHVGAIHGSLAVTHQVLANLLARADVAFLRDRSDIDPIGDVGLSQAQFTDAGGLTISGGYSGEKHDRGKRLSGRVSTTWLLPRHRAKLGLEYIDNGYTWDEHFGTGRGGGGYVTRYDDTTWTMFQYHLVGSVHMRMPSVYIQDSWSAASRLHINAGLRWDGPRYSAHGEVPLRVNNAVQPRCGIVYSTSDAGTDKISGSWGRYFEQLPAGNPGTYFVDVYPYFAALDHDPRLDPPVPDTAAVRPIIDYGTLRGEYFEEWTSATIVCFRVGSPRAFAAR
jgi:TonB dependent receptor